MKRAADRERRRAAPLEKAFEKRPRDGPAVALVEDVAVRDAGADPILRGRAAGRLIDERAEQRRRMREVRLFEQPADFDLGVFAAMRAPEERDEDRLAEDRREVAAVAGGPAQRFALGQCEIRKIPGGLGDERTVVACEAAVGAQRLQQGQPKAIVGGTVDEQRLVRAGTHARDRAAARRRSRAGSDRPAASAPVRARRATREPRADRAARFPFPAACEPCRAPSRASRRAAPGS